ncbi:hypothetical protein GOEFS_121_00640 [Gordonia effusa NBRC 100432]|uniref:Uncharacterized protein n=1 Tax=Gordonia effusa NBRC 100432 TaxID=1077974 RepID=H0R6G1_9ACTN|nr:hypothetical protein GOEFS_121_00640 [Gordonia effusa NBRC 100432]
MAAPISNWANTRTVIDVETLIGKNLHEANQVLGQENGPRKGAPGMYLYEISASFNNGTPVMRDFGDRPQDWIIVGACGRTGNAVSLGLVDRPFVTPEVEAAAHKNKYAGDLFECPGERVSSVTVTPIPK